MYNPGGGGEGCSGSMKRTPTPEEREREAKVCGALGGWGLSCIWSEGLGTRGTRLEGEPTRGLKPSMKGPCQQGNQSPRGLCIRAGLVLLDPLTNGRHPFACSAPTSLGESVATPVPQFTGLPDDCDGTRCAFLFGNNFGGVRSDMCFGTVVSVDHRYVLFSAQQIGTFNYNPVTYCWSSASSSCRSMG